MILWFEAQKLYSIVMETQMSERRDDTTKEDESSQPESESHESEQDSSYYYDDATGYEVYNPEEDEEDA